MTADSDLIESGLFTKLVTLADTLVNGFDLLDMATDLVDSCVEFLPVRDAGIMLDDQRGSLRVLASTHEEARLLELFELQNNEGPCLEAFATGEVVAAPQLSSESVRWPTFVSEAASMGILGAYAVPMTLRDRRVGALNLFCDTTEGLTRAQLHVAEMLTTMATLGILNHWSLRRQEVLAEQLQLALNSRIVIEQAKGIIAERSNVEMGEAFDLLRRAARASRRTLDDVASDVTLGRITSLDVEPLQSRRAMPRPGDGP